MVSWKTISTIFFHVTYLLIFLFFSRKMKIIGSASYRSKSPFLFKLIDGRSKVSKNHSHRSIKREDIRVFSHFWTWKKVVPPLSPLLIKLGSWNSVNHSKGQRSAFWWFRLLRTTALPYSLEMWFFGRVFHVSSLLFAYLFQIELESWNFICRMNTDSRCDFRRFWH